MPLLQDVMPVELNGSEAGGCKDGRPKGISPMTEIEGKLEKIAGKSASTMRDVQHLNPPDGCDLCNNSIEGQRFLIDGTLRDDPMMWGYMCPDCFEGHGSGSGWGFGQLYQRQADGKWLLMAGGVEDRSSINGLID